MPPKILAQYAQRATRITAAWLLRTSRGRARARQSSRASHLHACEGWGERAARREKGETTTWTTVAWLLLSGPNPNRTTGFELAVKKRVAGRESKPSPVIACALFTFVEEGPQSTHRHQRAPRSPWAVVVYCKHDPYISLPPVCVCATMRHVSFSLAHCRVCAIARRSSCAHANIGDRFTFRLSRGHVFCRQQGVSSEESVT